MAVKHSCVKEERLPQASWGWKEDKYASDCMCMRHPAKSEQGSHGRTCSKRLGAVPRWGIVHAEWSAGECKSKQQGVEGRTAVFQLMVHRCQLGVR